MQLRTRGQKKGKIAFAYPVEYPRRMTDRGMYAKISAYRVVEMALLTIIFKTTNPTKLLVSKKNSAK